MSTSIYYLLPGNEFSAFHRIKQDEIWHFYDGSALTLHIIDRDARHTTLQLGDKVEEGETFQAVIKAGDLFAATVQDNTSYALIGCTVAPGFEFADFEAPSRDTLLKHYPEHEAIINKLTRS